MPILLHIETATTVCSVALSESGNLLAFSESSEPRMHADALPDFINQVLLESKKNYGQLDAIAVSKGPGSYTGLRIGVSTAKGIAFGLAKPIIAVPTLQAMSVGAVEALKDKNALYCPMIDARRMEVYCALYDSQSLEVKAVSADILTNQSFSEYLSKQKIYFFGDGAEKCKSLISEDTNAVFPERDFVSARNMIAIAERKFANAEFENTSSFEPYYLKDFYTPTKG